MQIRQFKAVKATYVALFLGGALSVAGGCGDDAESSAACGVGDTRECLGPGACKGAQECKPDGSGFEPCACGTGGTSDKGGEGNDPSPGIAGSATVAMGGTAGTEMGGAPGTAGSGEEPLGGTASEGGAGGSPVEYECHPIGNVGCDASHNCSIDGGVDPQCVTAGTKDVLEACTNTGECAPGLSCHLNNCLKVCAETDDCESADATIKCGLGFENEQVGLIGSCVKNCDVLTQNCPEGQACYLGSCLTPTLAHTQAGDCGFATDCAEGLDCLANIDDDNDTDCTKYCSTAVQNPCGQGFMCYALNEVFATVPATWGVCVLEP
jgi:hypothetical protein